MKQWWKVYLHYSHCLFPTFGHYDNVSWLTGPLTSYNQYLWQHLTATFSSRAYKNCIAITSTLYMRTFQMLIIIHLKEFSHKDWGVCNPNHHLQSQSNPECPSRKTCNRSFFPNFLAMVVYRSAGFSLRIIYCLCKFYPSQGDSLDPPYILAIALDFTQASSFIF